jgi:FtsP/CotA-like multicopper oxidase with cupredoxin domain
MGQTKLDATLTSGPATACETGSFPSAALTASLQLTPNPKNWLKATGILSNQVAVVSPTWQQLDGVGSTSTVTEGTLLYFRSSSAVQLRITQATTGGDTTTVHSIGGLFMWEFPSAEPLTLLEVQGTATIEYFIQGDK